MKESLLNKNYEDRIKVTKSIYEPRASYKLDLRNSKVGLPISKPSNRSGVLEVGEHRVENIDKINCKIQHILSCLRETDQSNN